MFLPPYLAIISKFTEQFLNCYRFRTLQLCQNVVCGRHVQTWSALHPHFLNFLIRRHQYHRAISANQLASTLVDGQAKRGGKCGASIRDKRELCKSEGKLVCEESGGVTDLVLDTHEARPTALDESIVRGENDNFINTFGLSHYVISSTRAMQLARTHLEVGGKL